MFKEVDIERMRAKFEKADLIYVGGGDTVFMLDSWRETGLLSLIKEAYERGVIVAGLSAGAICWFEDIYTDSLKTENGDEYAMFKGLGWVKGVVSPHYNTRATQFDAIVKDNFACAYGIEDNAAILIENEQIVGTLSSGGNVYKIQSRNEAFHKQTL